MLEYHAAYYPIEDGWYMAIVLDFPGAISQGKSLRSARRMIRDALRLLVECHAEEGLPLPRPDPKAKGDDDLPRPAFKEKIPVRVRATCGGVE